MSTYTYPATGRVDVPSDRPWNDGQVDPVDLAVYTAGVRSAVLANRFARRNECACGRFTQSKTGLCAGCRGRS